VAAIFNPFRVLAWGNRHFAPEGVSVQVVEARPRSGQSTNQRNASKPWERASGNSPGAGAVKQI